MRVRLARQQSERFSFLATKITQHLYVYQWMSQPQILDQTRVQIGQDVINKLGLVETLGLVRVSIQECLKDCFNLENSTLQF